MSNFIGQVSAASVISAYEILCAAPAEYCYLLMMAGVYLTRAELEVLTGLPEDVQECILDLLESMADKERARLSSKQHTSKTQEG